jgi:hypothetical protein
VRAKGCPSNKTALAMIFKLAGVFIAVNRFKFSMFDTADAERARAEVLAPAGVDVR